MDQVSLAALALMAGSLGFTAVALVYGIHRNLVRGRSMRAGLEGRLRRLPLGHLLPRAGINMRRFLHTRRLHEIECGLRSCEACQCVERCQRCLQTDAELSDFGFCPNFAMLSRAAEAVG